MISPRASVILDAILAAILVLLLTGCRSQLVLKPEDLEEGLVIVLPGIDGRMPYNEAACRTLCDDGVAAAVELRDWTAPLGPLYNQSAVLRNREVASFLAARIRSYQRAYPGRRVFLIGHSGGTAIAVWAAEALPPGSEVDGIILLGSSLSPGYDLSRALARSRGGIVSFHSDLDGGLLGIGTILFGTMDGLHTVSAGKVGFRPPPGADASGQYAKLFQIAWQPSMIKDGHGGGHFDYMGPSFLSARVGPLLRQPAWDPRLIAGVR